MPLTFDTPGLRFDAGLAFDTAAPVLPTYPPKLKKTMTAFKLELSRKKVGDKLDLGATHITAMTGNANYPAATRVPTDAQVQTAQTDLAAANAEVDAAEVAWKNKIQLRDEKEATWDVVMTARANNCEAVTPGNLAALTSTGFPLRSSAAPVGELPPPGNLAATARDNEGEVELSCDTVAGASSYEWVCRLNTPGTDWAPIKTSTTRKIVVTGLVPGSVYSFRARAIGAAGPGSWSDEAIKRAP